MEEHKPRNVFDIPKLFYFEAGNVHTGSRKHLRYRIDPSEGQMKVEVWRTDLCYEKMEGNIEGEATFPQSEEGFSEMLAFLEGEFQKPIDG